MISRLRAFWTAYEGRLLAEVSVPMTPTVRRTVRRAAWLSLGALVVLPTVFGLWLLVQIGRLLLLHG